jgi:ABC-type transport system substrate-binding protein
MMIIKTATGLAFAAACLTTIATTPADAQTAGTYGGPQTYQGSMSPNWSAGTSGSASGNYTPQNDQGSMAPSSGGTGWDPQRNVMEAQRYDRLVETNPAFRRARIRKECGPITDPQLRADCIASFEQYEPPVASSASSQRVTSSTARHHQYVGSSTAPRQYHSHSGR